MIALLAVSFGVSIVLVFWQILFLFESVPAENRAWRDRPAFAFRIVWPLIKLIDFYGSTFYSMKRHDAINLKLIEAGLEYSLTSGQFLAARWVSSFLSMALLSLVMITIGLGLSVLVVVVFPWGYLYPDLWVKRVIKKRLRTIDRDLPFYLDVITLSVEAGSNLTGALTQAVSKAPMSPLRQEFNRVLRDIRAGKQRADALREFSERIGNESLSSVVSGMIQAEKSGASLGPVLRSQATQLRNTRFADAEKRAMEAPVRLLAPLVLFIFPTTFVVLGFLVLSKMLQQNMIDWTPIVWAYNWPG